VNILNDDMEINEPSAHEYVIKNRLRSSDEVIHGWYRFVLGYPPHLVREYLKELQAEPERDWVLDPFCGTATTPVEARLQGFSTTSLDANPISYLATRVKLNWDVDVEQINRILNNVLDLAACCLKKEKLAIIPQGEYQLSFLKSLIIDSRYKDHLLANDFSPSRLLTSKAAALIPKGFISTKPLLRVLALRYAIENLVQSPDQSDFLKLALASTIVKPAGNVGFGPEVYRLPPQEDVDVFEAFSNTVARMIADLQEVNLRRPKPFPPSYINIDDARVLSCLQDHPPIGIIITSPPYPNEKDYTRSTRLESVLLGLITSKSDLRLLKERLLRSNTRNVFVNDDDDKFIEDIDSVRKVAEEIERKRVELNKTSGFERLYHRVARLYFGSMYRHLASLYPRLRPGARCAYVVGDQMSFFRVHIRTAELLADVALKAGYKVEGIQLWRTRRSTTTGIDLEENVLILKKDSGGNRHA